MHVSGLFGIENFELTVFSFMEYFGREKDLVNSLLYVLFSDPQNLGVLLIGADLTTDVC